MKSNSTMGKILKLLSHGASFTAGFAVGVKSQFGSQERVYVEGDGNPMQPWTGPSREYEYNRQFAEILLNYIQKWLDYDEMPVDSEYPNPFWKDDLRDIRREVSHRLADAEEGEDPVVKMTQRQRLLLYDLTVHGPRIEGIRAE